MTGKKELLARALNATGMLSLLPHIPGWRSHELRILTYHRVFDVGDEATFPFDPALISASTAAFQEQMEYVSKNFLPVSFNDVLAAIDGECTLPRRAVVVTFDDGHADTYTHAFPILRKLGMTAAVFVSTGYVGSRKIFWFDRVSNMLFRCSTTVLRMPGIYNRLRLHDIASRRHTVEIVLDYLKSLPDLLRQEKIAWLANALNASIDTNDIALSGTLTWEQSREMSKCGFEFGSHSVTHPILTRLDDAALDWELVESRACIEREIGKCIDVIAYPEGGPNSFDARVIAAVKRAGYRLGLSYIPGPTYLDSVDPFAVPRLQVERNTSRSWFQSMLELPTVFSLEIDTATLAPNGTEQTQGPQEILHDGESALAPIANSNDSYGWHVVLGANISGKVICINFAPSTPSEFFAQFGGEIHPIDLSREAVNSDPKSLVRHLTDLLESRYLVSLKESSVDAFVLHDLSGEVLNSTCRSELRNLFTMVNRSLKPGGFCYLGFRNAYSLSRIVSFWRANNRLRPHEMRDLLGQAGFDLSGMRMHPYLLDQARVLEVLPRQGYTSVKNSRLWRETVKEWCYGRKGARHFSPAYGLVASKIIVASPIFEQLAEKIRALPKVGKTRLEMTRCQLLWRKAIISFSTNDDRHGGYVAILTNDPQAIQRREVETVTLKALAWRLPTLHAKLPRVIAQFDMGAYRCFVLSEISGMTIDRACPGTTLATRNAMRFLSELHVATIERNPHSSTKGAAHVETLFSRAVARYPDLSGEFRKLAELVQVRLSKQESLFVWQHGDFKLENVILHSKSLNVAGVIDWELSEEHGLPILDLLYLIAYNRSTREKMRISDVYRKAILPWKFSGEENRLLQTYEKWVGLNISDKALWATLYMVHDVGVRYTFNLTVPDERARLEQLLHETTAALASRAAICEGMSSDSDLHGSVHE